MLTRLLTQIRNDKNILQYLQSVFSINKEAAKPVRTRSSHEFAEGFAPDQS